MAAIENGKYGLVFASGLAAIDAVIKLLEPGDEVISTNDLYGGTYRTFTKLFARYGIVFHFVPMHELSAAEKQINERTRLIWIETPTNPMMNVIDIGAFSRLARKHGILLAVDNTFATPCLQNPLDLGADMVMHSMTKFLGGHSDVVMGGLIVNDAELNERLAFIQNSSGAVPGPQDCFLVLRGIKTLHLRVQRHCENGEKIAHFLREQDVVDHVYWPGFKDHPNYAVAKEQMRGSGGMLSFSLKGNRMEDAFRLVSSTRLFTLAESLGGVESLISHPASMTHAAIPANEWTKAGVFNSLIRLSVGVEHADDLIEDLRRAFSDLTS